MVTSIACDSKPKRVRRLLRAAGQRAGRFGRCRGGAAAIEFAIVCVPFVALIGGILETSLAYWAQMNLEYNVSEAARGIYTGQFQTANASTKDTTTLIAAFRKSICEENGKPRPTLFTCTSVRLNVTVYDNFSSVAPITPTKVNATTGQRDWDPAFGKSYGCATSSSVVLIQAAVDYPVFFSLLNLSAVMLPGGKRVLQTATVFRAEPYNSSGAC